MAEGFIRSFVFVEVVDGALENVSYVGNLGAGESVRDYCLTSGFGGYDKRCVRECSIYSSTNGDLEKAQGSVA